MVVVDGFGVVKVRGWLAWVGGWGVGMVAAWVLRCGPKEMSESESESARAQERARESESERDRVRGIERTDGDRKMKCQSMQHG